LQKTTISLIKSVCLSVRPSVRPNRTVGSHGTNCYWIWFLTSIFQSLLRKFKFHYQLTRIMAALREDLCTFMIISFWIILRMRNISEKNFGRKSKQILCSRTLFFRKSYSLWDNVEKYRRLKSPQVTKWRMCFVYWITKTIKQHSEYVILIAFLWQKWLRCRAWMLRYRYFACIVKWKYSLCLITHYTQIRLEQITSSTVRNKEYLCQ
jgi:hypothetical protein